MRSTVSLLSIGLLSLIVACSDPDNTSSDESTASDDTNETTTITTTPSTSPSPRAGPSQEELEELELQEQVDDVTEAREAAWIARMEGFTTRDPSLPDLQATHADRALFGLIGHFDGILINKWMLHEYEDGWNVDVQSVTFPSQDVAILETCVTYTFSMFQSESGEALDGEAFVAAYGVGVPLLVNYTEEMWRTDEGWKLALSIPIGRNSGYEEDHSCRIKDDVEELPSAEEIESILQDANDAYFEALMTSRHDELSEYFTGEMFSHYTTSAPHYEGYRWQCPEYPLGSEPEEIPPFMDEMYEELYDASPDERRGTHISGREHIGVSILACARDLRPGFFPVVREGDTVFYGDSSTSNVETLDVLYPTEPKGVVYVDVCREHSVEVLDVAQNIDETFVDDRTITSTDSLVFVDGRWKISTRWNVETEEGLNC